MPRKVDPNGTAFLKRQVAELVAVVDAFADKLGETAKLLCEHEEQIAKLTEERDEQVRLKQYHKGRYDEAFRLYSEEAGRAQRYERERDEARNELQTIRWTLIGVEREREAARAVADTMRRHAYPPGPLLPWEKTSEHGR